MSDLIVSAAITAVPALLAAGAAWRASVNSKRTQREVHTTNGATLGEMVERLDRSADLTRRGLIRHLIDARGHNTPPDLDIVEKLLDETEL